MSEFVARRRKPAVFAVVAAVILGLAAAVVVPITAAAAPVALAGTVVLPSGAAAKSVTVTLLNDDPGHTVEATTKTSSSGSFTFAALDAADYTLKFSKTSTSFEQYLGGETDVDSAQIIALTDAGGNKRYVKVGLVAGGTISGSVKKASGSAIAGYTVKAYSGSTVVATTKTSTSGKYSFTGLEPGKYVLQASASSGTPTYATTYSGGASSRADADPVRVQAKLTTTYNFVLGSTAKVSGVVTGDHGTATNENLANVTVTPYRETASEELEALPALARKTNSAGAFTLSGLPAGEYSLRFDPPLTASLPPSGTVYGAAFLGGWPSSGDATRFTVAAGGSVSGKNIVLEGGVSISGTLRQQFGLGSAIPNSLVSLYPIKNLVGPDYSVTPRTTWTDATGKFTFTGVRPEYYIVLTGSFTDSNPADGITEDTTWTRKFVTVDASAGPVLMSDVLVQPRFTPSPTVPPTVSAPDGLQVGDTVTVQNNAWTTSGAAYGPTYSYQWYSGDLAIEGATGSSYQLAPGDLDTTVSVRVTQHDLGWGDGSTVVSAPGATQLGGALNAIQPPALSGEAIVGNTVSIDTGVWYGPNWGTVDPEFEITWLGGPDAGSLVPIGSGPTHRIDGDDFEEGGKLGWTVRASRLGFADSSEWAGVTTMYEGEFEQTAAPKVTKTSTALKVSNGSWTPTPSSFEYEWVIHKADGTVLEEVDGSATLPLTSARKGKYISVTVIPVLDHVGGSPAELVAQKATTSLALGSSAITGTARVDATITAPAAWVPTPTTTTYKWQYLSGSTWKTIAGATSASYSPTAGYLGKKLRVVQTAAKTGYPTTTKTSATVTVAAALAPGNTVAPSVPSPSVNVPLTASPGIWSPAPTGFTYQWKYNADGNVAGPFTKISGATSGTFTPPTSLAGKHLFVDVTTKLAGYATATETAYAGTVGFGVLKNLTPPKATKAVGPAPTDLTYTRVAGADTWSPTPDSVEYAWFYRVDIGLVPASAPNDPDITDSTTYQLVLQATAKKAGWTDGVKTTVVRTGVIEPNAPDVVAPMEGPYVDKPFTALVMDTHFPPTGSLTSVKLQWQYEKTPGTWVNISGATSGTFTPTGSTYAGKDLRYRTTRTAPGYFDLVTYSGTQEVQLGIPASPSGAVDYSVPLRVSDKSGLAPVAWDQPVTLSYRWDVSGSETGPWTAIATTPTYTPKPGDFDKWIRLEVRASRPGHVTQEIQLPAQQVGVGQLDAITAPKVVKSGNVLSATTGTWDAPGVTFGRQWIQFELNGSTSTIGTGPTLTLTSAMAGKKILLVLNAYAGASHVDSWSATLVAQTGSKPVALFPPQIMNDVEVGTTIWVDVPWDNGDLVQTYQWYRNGVAISGATDLQYTIPAGDLGTSLTVKVKASALGYASNTITVNAGAVRTDDPILNTAAPTLLLARGAGSYGRVGEAISVNPGTWNLPGVAFAYQWMTNEGPITGATSSSYVPRATDIGREVWVTVTASKSFYNDTTTAVSPSSLIDWGKAPQPIGYLPIEYNATTHVLKSSAPVVFDLPATLTYQWQWFDDVSPVHTYVSIDGANSTSYTVPSGSPAREYRLTVVPTLAGHRTEIYASSGLNVPAVP